MILHTINKAPAANTALGNCISLSLPGSGIVLIEDAVYAATDCDKNRELLAPVLGTQGLYALEADIQARGLSGHILPGIERISYDRFVELCTEFAKVQNWF